jgi:hypothetical protein
MLKPVLGGVSFHLPVPSMNMLNQTEPATFLILTCWAFLRDSYFLSLDDFEDHDNRQILDHQVNSMKTLVNTNTFENHL